MKTFSIADTMKAIVVSSTVALLTVWFAPTSARADYNSVIFGNLQTARGIGQGVSAFGGAVSIGQDFTTVYGSFVYGFGMFTEGRVRLGLSDPDYSNSDPQLCLGGELKYQFWNFEGEGVDDPFDLAFSGMFEYVDYDGITVTNLGANVIGSRPFDMGNRHNWAPYGRFNIRLSSVDDSGPGDGGSDFGFSATGGAMFELSSSMKAFGEVNIDDNTALNLGLEFSIK